MLNREYQKRATRQALRSAGARALYRPLNETRCNTVKQGATRDRLRPLADLFPMAYEPPEQFTLNFQETVKREGEEEEF